MHLDSPTSFGY